MSDFLALMLDSEDTVLAETLTQCEVTAIRVLCLLDWLRLDLSAILASN